MQQWHTLLSVISQAKGYPYVVFYLIILIVTLGAPVVSGAPPCAA